MRPSAWLICGVLCSLLTMRSTAQRLAQDAPAPKPAVAIEPVAAILNAFKSHPVVALSEGEHGNEEGLTFRLSLIRDPRFSTLVNDIVVECGSSRYQGLMDQFVRGSDVSDAELRQIWWQGIEPGVACDRPIYEDFVRGVRTLNASLPAKRQLRVLIGEPPVDWAEVHRPDDLMKWLLDRDGRFPADLIQREVLAKHRRALVVYGSGHLQRRNIGRNYERENTIVSLLESAGIKVFSIWATEIPVDVRALQADTASWRVPSLALLRNTVLGVRISRSTIHMGALALSSGTVSGSRFQRINGALCAWRNSSTRCFTLVRRPP
jgi:hypothetical protein